MRHILKLVDLAAEFLTRSQAVAIRQEIETEIDKLAPGDRVVVDFSETQAMTPSFADECFGKLAVQLGAERFKKLVSLVNADPTNRTLVNAVLADRLSMTISR